MPSWQVLVTVCTVLCRRNRHLLPPHWLHELQLLFHEHFVAHACLLLAHHDTHFPSTTTKTIRGRTYISCDLLATLHPCTGTGSCHELKPNPHSKPKGVLRVGPTCLNAFWHSFLWPKKYTRGDLTKHSNPHEITRIPVSLCPQPTPEPTTGKVQKLTHSHQSKQRFLAVSVQNKWNRSRKLINQSLHR